jgi:hypothetical protein
MRNLLVCGKKEAIRSFLNRPPPAAKHMNPVQLVTELLETSIEAHPNLNACASGQSVSGFIGECPENSESALKRESGARQDSDG